MNPVSHLRNKAHHIRTRDREDFCFFGGRDRQEEGEASARKCFTFPPLWIDLTPRDDGKDASAANGGFVPHSRRSAIFTRRAVTARAAV